MDIPRLAYVALAVDEPCRTAGFFEAELGLPGTAYTLAGRRIPAVAVARTALVFFEPGDPFLGSAPGRGVHHIAIEAEDPTQAAAECGLAAGDELAVQAGPEGRRQVGLDPGRTCGLRLRFTEPVPLPVAPGCSDAIERIDHVGVASIDNDAARAVFEGALGCRYESEQIDSELETISESFTSDVYPAVFHRRPPRLRGSLRVTFVTIGDCELEFLQDRSPAETAGPARPGASGSTRGDRSAIARFVDRRGPGLHHLALETPDIDAVLERLAGAGHRVIDTTGRPGSRCARIGFVHPSATGGVLLHFVEREARVGG